MIDISHYEPPFRVGRKQKRVVLDNRGYEVVKFDIGCENMAQGYCDFLNSNNPENKDNQQAQIEKIYISDLGVIPSRIELAKGINRIIDHLNKAPETTKELLEIYKSPVKFMNLTKDINDFLYDPKVKTDPSDEYTRHHYIQGTLMYIKKMV